MIFLRKVWSGLRSTTIKAYAIKLAICVSIFLFAILVWWHAIWMVAVVACLFIACEFNVKSIVYILFFSSFLNNDYGDWISVMVAFFAIVCLVLFIVKTTRKEKNQSALLLCGILAFIAYGFLTSIKSLTDFAMLDRYAYIALHMVLLFFVFVLKKDLNFKHLVFFFIAGILTSSVIGAFVEVIPALATRIAEYRSYGLTRFCGLTGNPNRFHMFVLAGIVGLFVLDLQKQVLKRQLFPLLAILLALGLSTVSRTFFVVIVILLVAYITLKIVREKKAALKRVLVIGAVTLAICLVMAPYTGATANRIINIPEKAENQIIKRLKPLRHDRLKTLPELPPDFDDPGREGIWERNLKDWMSSPTAFLFGRGFGSQNIGQIHQHNDIVFFLVKSGLVGLLLFIFFLFTLCYTMFKVKKYKFCLVPFLFLLAFVGIGMFELIIPKIQGIIYFIFFVLCFANKETPTEIPAKKVKPLHTTKETSI